MIQMLDERIAVLQQRIKSGRGSQKLINERREQLAAVQQQRADLLASV